MQQAFARPDERILSFSLCLKAPIHRLGPRHFQNQCGFTLIELSIVLVVIGLIVGGILTGQSLIHQARLNKLVTDLQKFRTAANTFRTKYDCLPGDCTNATRIWGDAGDCNTVGTASNSQAATCNGNGDGVIGPRINYGSYCPNTVALGGLQTMGLCVNREQFTFWQQLSSAGLIEGQYSGGMNTPTLYGVSANGGPVPGQNVPDSGYPNTSPRGNALLPNLVWMIVSQGSVTGSYVGRYAFPPYINTITLSAVEGSPSYFYWLGMTPRDLYGIDAKLDDGFAVSGHIVATQVTGNCYNAATGAYTILTLTGDCSLNYQNAF